MSYDHVIVSPHADDAVFSLGGTIAQLARAGASVAVATVFTRGPAEATRVREDESAITHLGAERIDLGFTEVVARRRGRPLPGLTEADRELVLRVTAAVESLDGARLIAPLGVALHPDHEISWLACAPVARTVAFYEEVPYALCPHQTARRLAQLAGRPAPRIAPLVERIAIARWWMARPILREVAPVPFAPLAAWLLAGTGPAAATPMALAEERRDISATMHAKMAAIACYETQWPRFYRSLPEFRAALAAHSRGIGSSFIVERLFRRP